MLRIDKKTLTEALSNVSRAGGGSNGRPASVRLHARGDTLTASGGSPELFVERTVPADIETRFEASFPVAILEQLARSLPGDSLTLTLNAHELILETGSAQLRLNSCETVSEPDDWPPHYPLSADADTLQSAITAVSYAASNAAYQPMFRGVLIEVRALACTAVATDGFRLAAYRFDLGGAPGTLTAALPRKSADEIARILGPGEVRLAATDAYVYLQDDGLRLRAARLEGTFPDWRRVLPGHFIMTAEVEVAGFVTAIKRATILADREANNRIDLTFAGGDITLRSAGVYGGSREAVAATLSGEAETLESAVNADFLLQALSKISGTVLLQLSGSATPMLVSQLGATAYTAMFVPLRTE